jgi:hypothetical protein
MFGWFFNRGNFHFYRNISSERGFFPMAMGKNTKRNDLDVGKGCNNKYLHLLWIW